MIRDTLAPIADHLWQSTLFAAAAGLLTLALRHNRAAIRYALWLAASAKFLIPFSLLVAVGSQIQWHTAPVIALGGLPVAVDQMFAPPVFDGAAGHAMVSTASPIPAMILVVWALGFAAVLFSWWRAWRPIRAALRRATPLRLSVPGLAMFLDVRCSPDLLEPAVIGIRRPVLLLPDGIADRLQPSELQAIFAHELCHIRRHDNLAAMMQMLVEALFWFHPLVWWLEARLVDERERACDEAVLRSGNDPAVYAESILKICRFYVHSQLACASGISGADLKKRVEAIMINRVSIRMNAARKLLLATSAAIVIALPLVVGACDSSPSRSTEEIAKETAEVAKRQHLEMMVAIDNCKNLTTDANVNLMKERGDNPIGNKVTILKNGQITWNGSGYKMDLNRLREYLDQTVRMVPIPYLIVDTQAGYSQNNLDEVHKVIYESGLCKARPATPRTDPYSWATEDDYPPSALREERAGTSVFRVAISAEGQVTACTITSSSGTPALDKATCDLVTRRARFNPREDENGKPATGSYSKSIRWVIPRD